MNIILEYSCVPALQPKQFPNKAIKIWMQCTFYENVHSINESLNQQLMKKKGLINYSDSFSHCSICYLQSVRLGFTVCVRQVYVLVTQEGLIRVQPSHNFFCRLIISYMDCVSCSG